MLKGNKWIIFVISGTLVLAAAAGYLFINEVTTASAAVENLMRSDQFISTINTEVGPGTDGFNHRGRPGFPGRGPGENDFLAEALDISSEELQDARESAQQAALDQALADGTITQEQYDMMVLRGSRVFSRGGFGARGSKGGDAIDFDALLANELGISADDLMAAREKARDLAMEQALADGVLTQEQVDMLEARKALQEYIDKDVLLAQSFGLTVEELAAARNEGKSISDILAEQGLTAVEVREAMQAAHEAAVQQAIDDGVITAEQAESFQNGFPRVPFMDGARGPGGFGGCRDSFGEGGFGFPGQGPNADTNNDL